MPRRCSTMQTRPKTCSVRSATPRDRKSTRLNSSHLVISYAVFCLKKKKMPDAATNGFWVGQTPLETSAYELQVIEPADGHLAHVQVVDFQSSRCGPTASTRFAHGL